MNKKNSTQRWVLTITLLFAAVLCLHTWSLLRYPAPFTDEGWYANRTWAFLATGQAFGPADSGVLENFPGYWTYFQWLPTWFRSLSMRFFTVPDLLSVRIVSLFFGILLLWAIYAMGTALGGREMGVLGALLVSLSAAFLYSAHLARDDVIAASFGYLALAFYLMNRQRRRIWLGFFSGLCLGLAFEIHPHSAIFAPAAAALYVVDEGRHFFRGRHFWGFLAGGVTAGLFFLERHLLRFPGTFSAISNLFFLDTHTPPILTLDLQVISQGFVETGLLLFGHYLTLAPVVLWAAVTFVWMEIRPRRAGSPDRPVSSLQPPKGAAQAGLQQETPVSPGRTLLFINFILLVGLSLLVRNKFRHYAILVTPAIDLLLAGYLLHYIRRPWQGRVQDYTNRAAWGLLAVTVFLNCSILRFNPQEPYARVEARLRAAVRPGEMVVGPETYWFALYDHHYPAWLQLVIYQRYAPGSSLIEAFQALQPDIFILDGNMNIFVADQAGDTPFLQHFRLLKTELDQFLSDYATLVDSIQEPGWVPVEVYRINREKLALQRSGNH